MSGLPSLAFASCGTWDNPCSFNYVNSQAPVDSSWFLPPIVEPIFVPNDPYSGGSGGGSAGNWVVGSAAHAHFCDELQNAYALGQCQGTPADLGAILGAMQLEPAAACMVNRLEDAATCWNMARAFDLQLCQLEDDISLEWACISTVHLSYPNEALNALILQQPALHALGRCRGIVADAEDNQCPL